MLRSLGSVGKWVELYLAAAGRLTASGGEGSGTASRCMSGLGVGSGVRGGVPWLREAQVLVPCRFQPCSGFLSPAWVNYPDKKQVIGERVCLREHSRLQAVTERSPSSRFQHVHSQK